MLKDILLTNKYYGVVYGDENSYTQAIKIYCKSGNVNELIRKLQAIGINVNRGNQL